MQVYIASTFTIFGTCENANHYDGELEATKAALYISHVDIFRCQSFDESSISTYFCL